MPSTAAIASTLEASDVSSGARFLISSAVAVFITRAALWRIPGISWIYVLLLLPLVKFSFITMTDYAGPTLSSSRQSALPIGPVHPIARLFVENTETFRLMLESQSQTLERAVLEYKKRYGRAPPPGFDRWFEIAMENEFQLVDEFDTIMDSLEPFWGIDPASLRARIDSAEQANNMFSIHVSPQGAQMDPSKEHSYATKLMDWTNATRYGDILPTVKFIMSAYDEPRVVAPYDTIDQAVSMASTSHCDGKSCERKLHHPTSNDVHWMDIGKQHTFEAMRSSCRVNSSARTAPAPGDDQTHEALPFVSNISTALDVCTSPDMFHGHGILTAPDTMILTHSLVPIFSQCKPSIFSDVLYPSPYYGLAMPLDEDDTHDMPWDDKLDRVYWAGSSTGGYARPETWATLHRQRLTLATEPNSSVPVTIFEKKQRSSSSTTIPTAKNKNAVWTPTQTTYGALADLFYLRITKIVQCAADACDAMRHRFITPYTSSSFSSSSPEESPHAALHSKYALDTDGNAYSGRYYRLLKSNSAVIKHTAFREWHDRRLVPWVHFIPLSPGADEFGELVRFLTREETGRGIGERIAVQGRRWARRSLRDLDLELVFVRLLIEYGRLLRDDRDEVGFGL
jgi:hypothetical protein